MSVFMAPTLQKFFDPWGYKRGSAHICCSTILVPAAPTTSAEVCGRRSGCMFALLSSAGRPMVLIMFAPGHRSVDNSNTWKLEGFDLGCPNFDRPKQSWSVPYSHWWVYRLRLRFPGSSHITLIQANQQQSKQPEFTPLDFAGL